MTIWHIDYLEFGVWQFAALALLALHLHSELLFSNFGDVTVCSLSQFDFYTLGMPNVIQVGLAAFHKLGCHAVSARGAFQTLFCHTMGWA
jgi:hypothetical protein